MRTKHETMKLFYLRLLQAVDSPEKEASITADALLDADIHGLDTHGALRIPLYIK